MRRFVQINRVTVRATDETLHSFTSGLSVRLLKIQSNFSLRVNFFHIFLCLISSLVNSSWNGFIDVHPPHLSNITSNDYTSSVHLLIYTRRYLHTLYILWRTPSFFHLLRTRLNNIRNIWRIHCFRQGCLPIIAVSL